MKEKPIIFNPKMVRAVRGDMKTQTRRVIKPKPLDESDICEHSSGFYNIHDNIWECGDCGCIIKARYQPGDILWVRETWSYETYAQFADYFYRADEEYPYNVERWKPSIHMPREAARIFLRVTDVRVERLQEITPDDCVAEGMEAEKRAALNEDEYWAWYRELWNDIYAKDGYGWDVNPWIWVCTFERIKDPSFYLHRYEPQMADATK